MASEPVSTLLLVLNGARNLDARERVGDAERNAEQPFELDGEAAAGGRTAGDQDLDDAERLGLLLIEAQRGDELTCERLELGDHRPARLVGLAGVEPGGRALFAQSRARA